MIFEKREYVDGGPNDRGYVIGYIKADSFEEATKILNIDHSFIQLYEISEEEFNRRKQSVFNDLKQFDI